MERTNPLFEPTAAGVPARGRDGVDGGEDARRRARAGGTLASAVELRTDGTAPHQRMRNDGLTEGKLRFSFKFAVFRYFRQFNFFS